MQAMQPITNIFQSTLSVRRATWALTGNYNAQVISIHALRKESDIPVGTYWREVYISIHALRKESDRSCRM